jgi:hypothetical protein
MPALTPCKRREFIRKLRALHYAGPYSGGNHSFMQKTPAVAIAGAAQTIRVPNTDIDDVGLLNVFYEMPAFRTTFSSTREH